MINTASGDSSFLFFALASLLLPLLSFVLLTAFGKKLPGKGDWLSTGLTGLAFLSTCPLLAGIFRVEGPHRVLEYSLEWFRIGDTVIRANVILDNLSVWMLGLVTFISLLVHIYSMAYMKNDSRYHRYWPYLSLFVFSMLGLVLSGNLLITYMSWELVGVSSYLMIGFWFERPKAARASQKSFIVNRVGDIGFLVALMALFSLAGTFDIPGLVRQLGLPAAAPAEGIPPGGLDVRVYMAAAGLTLAAFAKSAQFPLHSWLPDAMEGPTSVSSLIHAATMVAAGVFLLARLYPLFPVEMLDLIAVGGVFTAFLAASIALVQVDIKRVLAYSTISQLGFMMLGIGTGYHEAALFHLVTHAFFKCLLFLGAGAVIHHLHQLQDMRYMGGLRKEMPVTFWVYSLGAAALAGLPFLSGFLSKEMILLGSMGWALDKGGIWMIVPLTAVLTSLLTAWYIGRQWSMVFMGERRAMPTEARVSDTGTAGEEPVRDTGNTAVSHRKEGGLKMKLPMIILGLFTLFVWFSWNPFSTSHIPLTEAFAGQAGGFGSKLGAVLPAETASWISGGLLVLAVGGLPLVLFLAFRRYSRISVSTATQPTALKRFLFEGWYLDTVYNTIFVRPLCWLANLMALIDRTVVDGFLHRLEQLMRGLSKLIAWLDKYVVDGLVNFIGGRARALGDFFRGFQTGRVQQYMALAVFGLLILYLIKIVLDK